ncbi:hypothetical protein [Phytohabitans rumicis]|uniref:hypothetical protein n=1 Tax=Phytohabitans rumicis TaxID=1076125 RepID=UPI001FECD80D|nr:hypothetical protein [Phytohabitans rumicis]
MSSSELGRSSAPNTWIPAARMAVRSSGLSSMSATTAAGISSCHSTDSGVCRSLREIRVRPLGSSSSVRFSTICATAAPIGTSGMTSSTMSLRPRRRARAAADGL